MDESGQHRRGGEHGDLPVPLQRIENGGHVEMRMSAARQLTVCKYSRTGSPKRREPMASLPNFQTQPSSERLSERRPMNSTMKGFSQGCSGIRRKRLDIILTQ